MSRTPSSSNSFLLCLTLFLAYIPAFVYADDKANNTTVSLSGNDEKSSVKVKVLNVNGQRWLFLPGSAKEESITWEPEQESGDVEIMHGGNIGSLFFESADPDMYGMEYVHSSKENKAAGKITLFDESFNQVYAGDVEAIKGRGNSSWGYSDKKPYQVKLKKKADLLNPVNGEQKAKKWILLANAFDPTLVRNEIVYDFSRELGLECTPEGRPVNLYYDGVYRGMYYLCEKVEIGTGRVDIKDLESETEKANPDLDISTLETVETKDEQGFRIKYAEGITDPEDISGGYLIEVDNVFYGGEPSYFDILTRHPSVGVSKSPEVMSYAQAEYISQVMKPLGRCLLNKGIDPETGKSIFDIVDRDSVVKCLLTNEFFQVNDAYWSSTFFYKDAGDDKIYGGPIWDCDASMGLRLPDRAYDRWFSISLGQWLREIPEVRQAMQEEYKNNMRDIIFDSVLGDKERVKMKSVQRILNETEADAAMNYMIWDENNCHGLFYPLGSYDADVDDMVQWLKNRAAWIDQTIMDPNFAKDDATPPEIDEDTQKNTDDVTETKNTSAAQNVSAEIADLPTVKISKPKAGKRKVTVKWKKISKKNLKKISGIQIQVATDPSFTNIVKTATAGKKKTSKVIKGLSPKTKYYVRIRAYAAGDHVSAWKSKSAKVK